MPLIDLITDQNLRTTQLFVEELKLATLNNGNLASDTVMRLRQPIQEALNLDPDVRLAVDLFLSSINGSQKMYTSARASVL